MALSKALGDIHFERFSWSGSNSHRARCRAATALRQHIRNCTNIYPQQDHFIIAHSHGGNVVLYALRDKDIADSVRGVVCLSTPFIHCRHRVLGPAGLIPVGLLAYFMYLWTVFRIQDGILAAAHRMPLPILNRTGMHIFEEFFTFILLFLFGVVCPLGLLALIHWFVTRWFSVPDLDAAMEALEESFQFPVMTPGSLLVIRSHGDEASGALVTSQFFSLVLTVLSRSLTVIIKRGAWLIELTLEWSLQKQLGYGILITVAGFTALLSTEIRIIKLFGCVVLMLAVIVLIPLGIPLLGMLVIAIAGVPLLVLLTLITLVSAPFGLDTALLAPKFEITAEATPPGKVTVFELSSEVATSLWHSAPYGSQEAFREITSWIRSLRSDLTTKRGRY
jgi:hypothetical protein